jgi:2-polyprenyl-3-methyl-5-hydroxy-6-metoxy-1,4-benzoquinol methylase
MGLKQFIKNAARKHPAIEMTACFLQNNLLYRWVNFSGDGTFEENPEAISERCRTNALKYISRFPGDLAGKRILEIGTGRSTLTAYHLAALSGATHVYTNDAFEQVFYDLDRVIIGRDLPHVDNVTYAHGHDALESLEKPMDYIVSNAVLEHVWNLPTLLAQLRRLSHQDTFMCHQIDLRNHNKFDSLGPLYFHSFSNGIWRFMASRVGHPNRLFPDDYRHIFNEAGFSFNITESTFHDEAAVDRALATYLRGRSGSLSRDGLMHRGILVSSSPS